MRAIQSASLDFIQFNELIESTAEIYMEKGQKNLLPFSQRNQINYDIERKIEEIHLAEQPVMTMNVLLAYIKVKIIENITDFVKSYDTDNVAINTELASYTYAVCSAFHKIEPFQIGLSTAYKFVLEMLIKHLLSGEWQSSTHKSTSNQVSKENENIDTSQLSNLNINQVIKHTAELYLEEGKKVFLPINLQKQITYDIKRIVRKITFNQDAIENTPILHYIQVKVTEDIYNFTQNYNTENIVLNTQLASYTYTACSAYHDEEDSLDEYYKYILEILIENLLNGDWQIFTGMLEDLNALTLGDDSMYNFILPFDVVRTYGKFYRTQKKRFSFINNKYGTQFSHLEIRKNILQEFCEKYSLHMSQFDESGFIVKEINNEYFDMLFAVMDKVHNYNTDRYKLDMNNGDVLQALNSKLAYTEEDVYDKLFEQYEDTDDYEEEF